MLSSGFLTLRISRVKSVTSVAHAHSHAQKVAQLAAEFEKEGSRERWLREKSCDGKVSYANQAALNLGLILFRHKEKRNAFTGAMMADFSAAVKEAVEEEATRCIVLRGEAGHFCSGGELSFVEKIANEKGSFVMNSLMMETLNALARSEKVSVAVLEGNTMGGASEIASACDIRVAHRKAKVGFVQGKMGVCPGWGGGRFLVSALGASRAAEYLATAAVVEAEELHRIGYVNHLIDNEDDLNKFFKRFQSIESKKAFHAAKRLVATYSSQADDEAEEVERRIFMSVWGHDDHHIAIDTIRNALKRSKEARQ